MRRDGVQARREGVRPRGSRAETTGEALVRLGQRRRVLLEGREFSEGVVVDFAREILHRTVD